MASQYSFPIEKGSTFYIAFEYRDSQNNIINLTNYCARLTLQSNDTNPPTRRTYLSDTITTTHSFLIYPDQGKIVLQLSASATDEFNFNNALYDLDLKAPNEAFPGAGPNIIRVLTGNINIIYRTIVDPDPFVCNILTDPEQCLDCE